jgi:GAF domain-containing protein
MVVAFTLYLTLQQRRVMKLRSRLETSEADRVARTQQHYERLMALARVSRIMSIETDLKAVFDAITRTCHEMFECQRVSLMLVSPETGDLVVQSVAGDIDARTVLGERQKLGDGISGWVAQNGRPTVIGPEEMKRVPRPNGYMGNVAQAMVVPIVVRDQLVGVLNVGTANTEMLYDEEDLKALEVFAENAGTCIRHTEQAEWMRKTIQRLAPKPAEPAVTRAVR